MDRDEHLLVCQCSVALGLGFGFGFGLVRTSSGFALDARCGMEGIVEFPAVDGTGRPTPQPEEREPAAPSVTTGTRLAVGALAFRIIYSR